MVSRVTVRLVTSLGLGMRVTVWLVLVLAY